MSTLKKITSVTLSPETHKFLQEFTRRTPGLSRSMILESCLNIGLHFAALHLAGGREALHQFVDTFDLHMAITGEGLKLKVTEVEKAIHGETFDSPGNPNMKILPVQSPVPREKEQNLLDALAHNLDPDWVITVPHKDGSLESLCVGDPRRLLASLEGCGISPDDELPGLRQWSEQVAMKQLPAGKADPKIKALPAPHDESDDGHEP